MPAKHRNVAIPAGQFGEIIESLARKHGGYVNAHAHLDRACTIDPHYLEHYGITPLQATSATLRVKQSLTGELHKGEAYSARDLERRIAVALEDSAKMGVREIISFIDATPDIGLRAIEIAANLREKYRGKITLKIAAHPIFGFKHDQLYSESRWKIFEKACEIADTIGGLPERDDRPDSVGFDEHLTRILGLGKKLKKPVHVHVDQDNDPRQRHTLDLIEAVRWIGSPKITGEQGPTVWAVHAISPSSYSEHKFRQVLDGLKAQNIGVIVCPRAAISMRQNRALYAPTHNSIARVLEMAYYDIPVLLGTDNIADMFVPTSSDSMLYEVLRMADDLRFYIPEVLAKLAARIPLNHTDKEAIRLHLVQDLKVFQAADPSFEFCLPLEAL